MNKYIIALFPIMLISCATTGENVSNGPEIKNSFQVEESDNYFNWRWNGEGNAEYYWNGEYIGLNDEGFLLLLEKLLGLKEGSDVRFFPVITTPELPTGFKGFGVGLPDPYPFEAYEALLAELVARKRLTIEGVFQDQQGNDIPYVSREEAIKESEPVYFKVKDKTPFD